MNLETMAFVNVNAQYAVLSWEPVASSGEHINVGALVEYRGRVSARSLIRSEVLACMYGVAGDGLAAMINGLIEAIAKVGSDRGWDAALAANPLSNFAFSPPKATYASSETDLFRQIVLMNFSLSVLADEGGSSADEVPTPEREVNQQWTTRVREAVQIVRPDLSIYFNRDEILVDNGVPVRFGLLTPRLVAHFGLLRATGQGQAMKDARAKMWELSLALERKTQLTGALVFGIPTTNDVTLTDRQRTHLQANTQELRQEANQRRVELRPVQTVVEAVEAIVALI